MASIPTERIFCGHPVRRTKCQLCRGAPACITRKIAGEKLSTIPYVFGHILMRQNTRWPVKDTKVFVSNKVKESNLTIKGDYFCGIFAFYNTSIISAANAVLSDVVQICQALINS